MIKLSKDLEAENAKAFESMEPKLRAVMAGKRLATMSSLVTNMAMKTQGLLLT